MQSEKRRCRHAEVVAALHALPSTHGTVPTPYYEKGNLVHGNVGKHRDGDHAERSDGAELGKKSRECTRRACSDLAYSSTCNHIFAFGH